MIGGGPSGRDIAGHVAKRAKRVTISRRIRGDETVDDLRKLQGFGSKVTIKGEVKRLTKNGAVFKDGTHDNFNAIIYATGIIIEQSFPHQAMGITINMAFIFRIRIFIPIPWRRHEHYN